MIRRSTASSSPRGRGVRGARSPSPSRDWFDPLTDVCRRPLPERSSAGAAAMPAFRAGRSFLELEMTVVSFARRLYAGVGSVRKKGTWRAGGADGTARTTDAGTTLFTPSPDSDLAVRWRRVPTCCLRMKFTRH